MENDNPTVPQTTEPHAPAVAQDTAAAERSAHVTRGEAEAPLPARCFVCGGPWRKGDASFAVRAAACFPGLQGVSVVEVCSAECRADPRWATPGAAA
jgi:hypothetical protein